MLIGGDSIGRPVIGQIGFGTAAQVAFGWLSPLSEPQRQKPGLRSGAQQFLAFNPQPFVSFSWFAGLSEPQRQKRGLKPGQQQFIAFYPAPSPFVATGWFMALSEPQWKKPRSPAALYPSFFFEPAPSPFVATGWFEALSEPQRQKKGLHASRQQFLAAPSRLLPNPNLIAIMAALETKDTFLGGARFWDRIVSGEVGVIEVKSTGAEIGIVGPATPPGATGIALTATPPVSGAAVPVVTIAHVSIRIV